MVKYPATALPRRKIGAFQYAPTYHCPHPGRTAERSTAPKGDFGDGLGTVSEAATCCALPSVPVVAKPSTSKTHHTRGNEKRRCPRTQRHCARRRTRTCTPLRALHPECSASANSASRAVAERVGFEPTVPREGHNGFRDRPVQPLRHLSGAARNYSFSAMRRLNGDARVAASVVVASPCAAAAPQDRQSLATLRQQTEAVTVAYHLVAAPAANRTA